MRMKCFAMLAMSGLLATSLAYMAPAMADDVSNDQSLQMSSGTSGSADNPDSMSNPDSMNMQSPSSTSQGSDMGSTTNNNATNNPSANVGGDEGTPDTAT